jgi:hypothetical protein
LNNRRLRIGFLIAEKIEKHNKILFIPNGAPSSMPIKLIFFYYTDDSQIVSWVPGRRESDRAPPGGDSKRAVQGKLFFRWKPRPVKAEGTLCRTKIRPTKPEKGKGRMPGRKKGAFRNFILVVNFCLGYDFQKK